MQSSVVRYLFLNKKFKKISLPTEAPISRYVTGRFVHGCTVVNLWLDLI